MHDANIEHPFQIWTQTTYDWNLMKRIQVIINTRNTHDWATRLIKKSLNAQQLNNVIHQNINYICLLVMTHLEIICSSIQWGKCTHLLYNKYRELCSMHLLKGLFHLTSQQHQTCYLQCRRYWWTLHGQMGVHFFYLFSKHIIRI